MTFPGGCSRHGIHLSSLFPLEKNSATPGVQKVRRFLRWIATLSMAICTNIRNRCHVGNFFGNLHLTRTERDLQATPRTSHFFRFVFTISLKVNKTALCTSRGKTGERRLKLAKNPDKLIGHEVKSTVKGKRTREASAFFSLRVLLYPRG